MKTRACSSRHLVAAAGTEVKGGNQSSRQVNIQQLHLPALLPQRRLSNLFVCCHDYDLLIWVQVTLGSSQHILCRHCLDPCSVLKQKVLQKATGLL